ncbi:hypothetical protein C8J56DRAFT_1037642 [Mycena floridula]|nr:hypothetical protein C8J56DRAFT_1037642 [Mycena floridula]
MGYNDVFGSVLIGTWIASALYMLVVLQSWRYFQQFPDDNKIRRALVCSALFICTLALTAEYVYVYLYTVTYWGNVELVSKQYWPAPLYVTSNTVIGTIVNSFMIHRFYSLSKNIWMTIVLGLMTLTALAGSFMVGIMLQIFSTLADRPKIETATLLWTISSAGADFSIAMALIWQLRRMKSAFKETQTLIRRIIIGTIQTGCTTTIVAIVALVTYLANPQSNVPTALEFPQGPLYVLTLLYNLNLRRHYTPNATGRTTSETRGNGNNILMDGIQVHRTAIVTMDPTESDNQRARQENNGKEHTDDISIASQHKIRVPDEF